MLLLTLWLLAAAESARHADAPRAALPDVAAAGCVCCGSGAVAPADLVASDEWLMLRDGGVLKRRTGRIESADSLQGGAQASSLLAYSPEQVWAVLTDFEAWPHFMPHLTDSQVTHREGQRQWVRQNFRILLIPLRHTTIYELDPLRGRLSWQLDLEQAHDISRSNGTWQLASADEGRSTLVHYASNLDSGRQVPGFVERMLFDRSIDELFASLRAELARRAMPAR